MATRATLGDMASMEPSMALGELVRLLREEDTVIAEHLVDPTEPPALAELVAAGPRAADHPGEYALVIESVREGYLLHYGESRLLSGADPDLALLAGDYLYALGLERLAELGDTAAVALLGDLISLAALCHSEGHLSCLEPLWLAFAVAVSCGETPELDVAVQALKASDMRAEQGLRDFADIVARDSEIMVELHAAKKAINFPAVEESNLG